MKSAALRLALAGLIAGCSSASATGPAAHAQAPLLHAVVAGAPAEPRAQAALPRVDVAVSGPPAVPAPAMAATPPADLYTQFVPSNAAASTDARRFVVLGDSLSAWVFEPGSSEPSTGGAWPWLLDARDSSLEIAHNASVPGNATGQMLARMERDVFAYNPDVLFILGGTNDVAYYVSDAQVLENIARMVRAARVRGIEVVLMTVPPNNDVYLSRLCHYRDISAGIRALGIEESVPVVDVYAALATPDGGLVTAYAARDKLHLSPAGEQAIADSVYSVMHPAGPPAHD